MRNVCWDNIFDSYEPHMCWEKFKSQLFSLCDVHIPKITIKSNFQPPWFDSDLDKLCKKKERLRQKCLRSKHPDDLDKFKKCRKAFKAAVKEKLRINVVDDSDPSLIS